MTNDKRVTNCTYCDAAMKYAYMQLTENFFALMDAEEMCFFDALFEKAKNKTETEFDETLEENVSYKLVYGGLLVNEKIMTKEEAIKVVKEMTGFSFAQIKEDTAITCQYKEIMLLENNEVDNMGIPFAAIMKLPEELNERNCSITLTPLFEHHDNMWERIVNRPFLLACRLEEDIIKTETETLSTLIDKEKLNEAFARAFIVEGVEEEGLNESKEHLYM